MIQNDRNNSAFHLGMAVLALRTQVCPATPRMSVLRVSKKCKSQDATSRAYGRKGNNSPLESSDFFLCFQRVWSRVVVFERLSQYVSKISVSSNSPERLRQDFDSVNVKKKKYNGLMISPCGILSIRVKSSAFQKDWPRLSFLKMQPLTSTRERLGDASPLIVFLLEFQRDLADVSCPVTI
jgi:hypothetical protein